MKKYSQFSPRSTHLQIALRRAISDFYPMADNIIVHHVTDMREEGVQYELEVYQSGKIRFDRLKLNW